jgi:hypothetical protein
MLVTSICSSLSGAKRFLPTHSKSPWYVRRCVYHETFCHFLPCSLCFASQKLNELDERDAELGTEELEGMVQRDANEAIVVCLDVSSSMEGPPGFRDSKEEEVAALAYE